MSFDGRGPSEKFRVGRSVPWVTGRGTWEHTGLGAALPGCGGRVVTGDSGGESWRWEADGGGEREREKRGRETGRRGEGASTGWWRWRGREGIEQQRRRGSGAASSHDDGAPAGARHTSALTGTFFPLSICLRIAVENGRSMLLRGAKTLSDRTSPGRPSGIRVSWFS